ncbi:translation initiation factor Sui1 [Methylocaldum marinum]|uniref:translation initiation factor Sui1 n=1 Tax=Methylocaldum marinum TaxID=1432792 RepID=UPI000E684AF6|nr:translation initiation factor Sui1 [Methylocaldum marinum]
MTSRKQPANGGLVYCTEFGRMCPACRKPVAECICRQVQSASKSDGKVRVRLETKGRKGKGVTVISGLPLDGADLERLCRQIKQRCGSGGTVKDGTIEIQGDHRERIMEDLSGQGWTVKRAGG